MTAERKCPMCGVYSLNDFRNTGEIVSAVVEKHNAVISAQHKDNAILKTVSELQEQIEKMKRDAKMLVQMNLRAASNAELSAELQDRMK